MFKEYHLILHRQLISVFIWGMIEWAEAIYAITSFQAPNLPEWVGFSGN
jgi:hypothetical protein